MRPWLDVHLMLQHTKTSAIIKMTMKPLLNMQLMQNSIVYNVRLNKQRLKINVGNWMLSAIKYQNPANMLEEASYVTLTTLILQTCYQCIMD